jgi:hypothetical protein
MKVFSLVKVVIVDLLSEWIEMKDLVRLDSAFCNSTSRDFLLDMFEKEYFTMGENFISTDCLRYVNNRKLKLKTLSLNNCFGSRKLIHNLTASKVRSLKIVGCRQWKLPRAELVSLFNSCLMLRELELNGVQSCCDDVIAQFNPTILKQLVGISFSNTTKRFTGCSIEYLAVHCVDLHCISLGDYSTASVRRHVASLLIPRNVGMQCLSWGDQLCRTSWSTSSNFKIQMTEALPCNLLKLTLSG